MWFYWNATGCIKRIIDMIVNIKARTFSLKLRAFKKCAEKVNALQQLLQFYSSLRKSLKRCNVDIRQNT